MPSEAGSGHTIEVQWEHCQQGRVGISQNTDGAELPPALLGRYDRRVLKSGFRSISQLLEFTGNPQWLKTI